MVHSEAGLFDVEETKGIVTIGNGKTIPTTMVGKLRATYYAKNGAKRDIVLDSVKVVPDLAPFNLFSITTVLARGYKLGNDGKQIYVEKGDFRLKFDQEIETTSGYVAGAKIIPRLNPEQEQAVANIAAPAMERGTKIPIKVFHGIFGHHSMASTKSTAKYYGIKLMGSMQDCEDCLQGKARQKNVGKGTEEKRATKPGHRLFFDISSIKNTSYGGSKFWLLLVDDATDQCFSYF